MRKLFPRRNQHLPVTYRMTATILSLLAAAYLALFPLALNNKALRCRPQTAMCPPVTAPSFSDNGRWQPARLLLTASPLSSRNPVERSRESIRQQPAGQHLGGRLLLCHGHGLPLCGRL